MTRNKKNFPTSAYLPARLVQEKSRWYIVVYERSKRYRLHFSLNRIFHLPTRKERADVLVKKINFWLHEGKPLLEFDETKVSLTPVIIEKTETVSIGEAIQLVLEVKLQRTDRRHAVKAYQSHANRFLNYLKKKKIIALPIQDFSTKYAIRYVDSWKIQNANTFNNRLTYVKAFFNVLVDREYISKNPFGKIKRRRPTKAKKENFTLEEMTIILERVKIENPWLWLATQLAFWGLVRQEELSRLRFKMFDFMNCCLRLSEDITKNYKEDVVTLPQFLRKELIAMDFFKYPSNYLIFGANLQPHPDKQIHADGLRKRFVRILIKLEKENKFVLKKGHSFSSIRRTGIDYFSRNLQPRELKDHVRHDSFATTEKYLPNRGIVDTISNMENLFQD